LAPCLRCINGPGDWTELGFLLRRVGRKKAFAIVGGIGRTVGPLAGGILDIIIVEKAGGQGTQSFLRLIPACEA